MEKTIEIQDRVLARVTASDLTEVAGGLAQMGGTSTVTGEPVGNINGSDITNVGDDADAY